MLVGSGPPLDLAETTFDRHGVYVTSDEVVFIFEGVDAAWEVDDLTSDALHHRLQIALEQWRPLIEGMPRLGREVFFWQRSAG